MSRRRKIFVYAAVVIIGLLALLSYFTISTGRGGGGHNITEAEVHAEGMEDYGVEVETTVTRMLRDKIKVDDLDFSLPGNPDHKLSDINYVYGQKDAPPLPSTIMPWSEEEALPLKAFDGQMHYVFTGANRIPGVGTDAPEILFIAWPIKKDICETIDRHVLFFQETWIEKHIFGKDWIESHILNNPPDLTPLHHEAGKSVNEIAVPHSIRGYRACLQDKTGVRYYIHTIIER